MIRLRIFAMFQRAAFRALFRRRIKLPDAWPQIDDEFGHHPSTLCRCFDDVVDDPPALAHADHKPDCAWAEAMCRTCMGLGWCVHCGGDGTEPELDETRAP